MSFFGDVFVGRVRTVPSPMRNVDFGVADLDSSSAWVKSAPEENYKCVPMDGLLPPWARRRAPPKSA